MKNIFVGVILFILFSFKCFSNSTINSPLTIVIKLQSAETLINFEEAKKYIDVERVYSGYSDSISPENIWKEEIMFFYNLAKDKKFTNVFKYYEYDISESISNNKSTVTFKSVNKSDKIKAIIYHLEKYEDNWKVIKIEYQKKFP